MFSFRVLIFRFLRLILSFVSPLVSSLVSSRLVSRLVSSVVSSRLSSGLVPRLVSCLVSSRLSSRVLCRLSFFFSRRVSSLVAFFGGGFFFFVVCCCCCCLLGLISRLSSLVSSRLSFLVSRLSSLVSSRLLLVWLFLLGGLVSSLFSSRLGSRLVWLSLGSPKDRKRKSYISLRISKKTRPRPKRGQRGAHEEVDAPEVVLRSGKGGKRKALLRRGRALAGLCLWGSRKESEKRTEKTKKKVKARKKRYRARSAGLTPFLGVPESRVSRPGRQTVDGFGVKTFKFQKKRSETIKSKKKRFRPKNVG